MRIFLTMKHWQLFILLVAAPICIQFVLILLMIAFENQTIMGFGIGILLVVSLGSCFGWLYSLGTNLYKRLPATATMSLIRFKIFFFIPIVYFALMMLLAFGAFSGYTESGPT